MPPPADKPLSPRATRCAIFDFADRLRPFRLAALAATAPVLMPSLATAQTVASQREAQPIVPDEPLSVLSSLTLSVGGAAWHGDFGAPTDTTISSAIVSARYQRDGLRLSAVIPYMRIESDGSFFAGIGGTPLFVAPQIRPLRRVREGWGDLTLGASYLLPGGETRGFDIDLTGRIKVPVASASSQLSTGKVDYSAGAEVSKTFGSLTPSVSVTYRVFGDTSVWNLRNGVDVSAGGSYALGRSTALVVNYEYVQASSGYITDSHELVAGASTGLTRRLRLTGYLSKGLSDGAADVSGGASLALRF